MAQFRKVGEGYISNDCVFCETEYPTGTVLLADGWGDATICYHCICKWKKAFEELP